MDVAPVAREGGGVGQHSVVGTAIRYRLDGPGFEPRWGKIFSASLTRPDRPAVHPTSYSISAGSLCLAVKLPEREFDQSFPCSAEVKE
jgi:hypothetical protein